MNIISNHKNFGYVGNLSSTINSTLEIDNTDGYNFLACHVTVPSGSIISFELTFDNINWDSFTLRSTELDIFVKSTSTNSNFIGSIIGAKKIRFKTLTGGSGVGSVIGNLTMQTATIESIEFGYPPHRFGFEPIHKDAEFTTQQTATALWTPASGKKIIITDVSVIVGGATDGTVSIFNGSGDTSGNRIFRGTIAVSTNKNFVYSQRLGTPFMGVVDGIIKITTSAAMTVDVLLRGYEI